MTKSLRGKKQCSAHVESRKKYGSKLSRCQRFASKGSKKCSIHKGH